MLRAFQPDAEPTPPSLQVEDTSNRGEAPRFGTTLVNPITFAADFWLRWEGEQRSLSNLKSACLLSHGAHLNVSHVSVPSGGCQLVVTLRNQQQGISWSHRVDYSLRSKEWYHIALSFVSGIHLLLAINGAVFPYKSKHIPDVANSTNSLHIEAPPTLFCDPSFQPPQNSSTQGQPEAFQGELSHIRWWREALSVPKILLLRESFLPRTASQPRPGPLRLDVAHLHKAVPPAAALWPLAGAESMPVPRPTSPDASEAGDGASATGGPAGESQGRGRTQMELGLIAVLRPDGEAATQLHLHLQTLMLSMTSATWRVAEVAVVYHVGQDANDLLRAVPPGLQVQVRLTAVQAFSSWGHALRSGLLTFSSKWDLILVADSGVQLTEHAVEPLLHRMSGSNLEGGVHLGAVAGTVLYPTGRIHSLGYSLNRVPILDQSYLLPIERWRGAPMMRHSAVQKPQPAEALLPLGAFFLAWRSALWVRPPPLTIARSAQHFAASIPLALGFSTMRLFLRRLICEG